MKQFFAIALVAGLGWASGASALTTIYSELRDYGSAPGKINPGGNDPLGADYVEVRDSSSSRFSDFFDFSSIAYDSISRFDLTLKFADAGPSGIFDWIEQWQVRVQGSNPSISSDDYFSTLRDPLSPQTIVISMATDTGSINAFSHSVATGIFEFWFSENTCCGDKFKLDSAQLDVIGTVIPAPAALPLLASGVAGFAWLRRRKMRSAKA